MMTKYRIFVLLIQALLCFPPLAQAGFDRVPQPVSVTGGGNVGTAIVDPEFLWINPASVASAHSFSTILFYTPSLFGLPQLRNTGFVMSDDLYSTGTAIGVSTFGFSLYRETVATIAAADTVASSVITGMGININHLFIDSYGSTTVVSCDIGCIINIDSSLSLGGSITNVNRPSVGNNDNTIVQGMNIGVVYRFLPSASIAVDFHKNAEYPLAVHTGVEWMPHTNIRVRCGFIDQTKMLTAGLTVTVSFFDVEYAIIHHPDLGISQSIGIIFTP